MRDAEKTMHKLFEELVPPTGKAETVAGEIVRAFTRIEYRNYNDGDHIGIGYGKETCNPAARYLVTTLGGSARETIYEMWGEFSDGTYDTLMGRLKEEVLDYLEQNPELKELQNDKDYYDYYDKNEDVDDTEDEEDW